MTRGLDIEFHEEDEAVGATATATNSREGGAASAGAGAGGGAVHHDDEGSGVVGATPRTVERVGMMLSAFDEPGRGGGAAELDGSVRVVKAGRRAAR